MRALASASLLMAPYDHVIHHQDGSDPTDAALASPPYAVAVVEFSTFRSATQGPLEVAP
jgi:hypothetical protein